VRSMDASVPRDIRSRRGDLAGRNPDRLPVSSAVNMVLRWTACVLVSGEPTGRQSERSQSAASLSARYAGSNSVFGPGLPKLRRAAR
jgi:hypothetical protein